MVSYALCIVLELPKMAEVYLVNIQSRSTASTSSKQTVWDSDPLRSEHELVNFVVFINWSDSSGSRGIRPGLSFLPAGHRVHLT